MCRLLGYLGDQDRILADFITKPKNSLIAQSHAYRAGKQVLNADGVGVAWYNRHIGSMPGVFKSVQPAWNDGNLRHIAAVIESHACLAHVRASTVGDVIQANCHPFIYGRYAFVHNGTIRGFRHYKRQLLAALCDQFYLAVKGNTDSEIIFYLILQTMEMEDCSMEVAVKQVIERIVSIQQGEDFSRLNVVITDGKSLVASRFASNQQTQLSLHYAQSGNKNDVIVASEPLGAEAYPAWQVVPESSYLTFDLATKKLHISPL